MQQLKIKDVDFLQFNSFPSKCLFHFSTMIYGGVSQEAYSSFNLGLYSGDNRNNVYENRRRLAKLSNISPDKLFIPYQTHDDKILNINSAFLALSDAEQMQQLNGIDALITNQKNIGIGVTTADCVPLLIIDPTKSVLAAIHAGWKGTVARIAAKTVDKMVEEYNCNPFELLVGIAPSISPECFEVGDEVGEAFMKNGFNLSDIAYRNEETQKLHIDLREANRIQLLETGVLLENIEISKLCTFSNPDKFFSARRQTIYSGRMLTGAVIK